MARKCIRKLILVLMELLIIPILVQVLHANDLAPTSLGPSSLSFLSFPNLIILLWDRWVNALKLELRIVRKDALNLATGRNYERCVEKSYIDCMDDVEEHEDPIYSMMKKCVGDCVRANKGQDLRSQVF